MNTLTPQEEAQRMEENRLAAEKANIAQRIEAMAEKTSQALPYAPKDEEEELPPYDGKIRIEEEDTGHLLFKYNCLEKQVEIKTTVGRAGASDIWAINVEQLLHIGNSNILSDNPVRVVKAKRLKP